MEIENIAVGSVLISDSLDITPLPLLLASGVDVIGVDEKGFRLRRRHSSYNGEEFFLTIDAMRKSHWRIAPIE